MDKAIGKSEWWANIPDGDAFMRLTHRQLRLAIAFRGFPSSKEGTVWASWATLASRSRMDVRKVRAIAGDLRDMGWLEWDVRPGKSNLFRLLAPLGCATTARTGCATAAQGGGTPLRHTEQTSTEHSRRTDQVQVQGLQPSASAKQEPAMELPAVAAGTGRSVADEFRIRRVRRRLHVGDVEAAARMLTDQLGPMPASRPDLSMVTDAWEADGPRSASHLAATLRKAAS
jgi:hypothetical protein